MLRDPTKVGLAYSPCPLCRLFLDSDPYWFSKRFLICFWHMKLRERVLEIFSTGIRPAPLYVREDHGYLSSHLFNCQKHKIIYSLALFSSPQSLLLSNKFLHRFVGFLGNFLVLGRAPPHVLPRAVRESRRQRSSSTSALSIPWLVLPITLHSCGIIGCVQPLWASKAHAGALGVDLNVNNIIISYTFCILLLCFDGVINVLWPPETQIKNENYGNQALAFKWKHLGCRIAHTHIYIYYISIIYIDVFFLHARVITLMYISLDLRCIWPDEVYIDEVYDHSRPRVICMLSMHTHIEYVVILTIYSTVVVFQ